MANYPDYIATNKPKIIRWEVVAPKNARLSPLQTYDVIYDEKDLNMRFPKRNNQIAFKRPEKPVDEFYPSQATQT